MFNFVFVQVWGRSLKKNSPTVYEQVHVMINDLFRLIF